MNVSYLSLLEKRKKEEQKRFSSSRILRYLFLFGGLYFLYIELGGVGLFCPFYLLSGYQCPGCGVTTMLMRLLHGYLFGAFDANAFLLCFLPIFIPLVFYFEKRGKKTKKGKLIYNIFLFFMLFLTLAWGIYRNIF